MKLYFTNRLNKYRDTIEYISDVEEYLRYKKEKEKKKKLIRKQFNEALEEMRNLLK